MKPTPISIDCCICCLLLSEGTSQSPAINLPPTSKPNTTMDLKKKKRFNQLTASISHIDFFNKIFPLKICLFNKNHQKSPLVKFGELRGFTPPIPCQKNASWTKMGRMKLEAVSLNFTKIFRYLK